MTETAARLEEVPIIRADPFTVENLTEPHALHEQLREAGPVVYLTLVGIWPGTRMRWWDICSFDLQNAYTRAPMCLWLCGSVAIP